MNNKWFSLKTNKVITEGDYVHFSEADFYVELVPMVYGCDHNDEELL